jgi:hypothetical protein
MELTWVAIIASLTMALGAACVFVFAVKRDYFHNIEDAKYQVFWSDLEEPDAGSRASNRNKQQTATEKTRRPRAKEI